MALLSLLKTKILAIGGFIIAVLLGVVKWQSHRNTTLKNEVNIARKQLKFKEDVIDSEVELDSKFSDLKRESDKDIKNGEIPDHLRNPRS